MKVVAHNGAPIFGGAEIAVCRLLAGLAGRGHEVVLYCNDRVVEEGAARHGVPHHGLHLGGDAALHHALRWARTLRRERPDAVVLTTFRKLWLGALGAWLADAPRVLARIGLSTDVPRNAKYRFVFRHLIDAVVFNADDVRRRYREMMPELSPERLVHVPTGVEPLPRSRSPVAVRAELGVPEGAPVVGAVGRLVEQKRFDRLLHALATTGSDVHLLVAGDGPLRAELERTAAELRLSDRVRFAGHREDVGDLLAAVDVLAVTSDAEGLANVMLEAMTAGVPVVSTPVSGAAEALREPLRDDADAGGLPSRARDPAGKVVPAEPAAIGRALETILRDAPLRERMSRAAVRRSRERFSRDAMLDGWERVLAAEGRGGDRRSARPERAAGTRSG